MREAAIQLLPHLIKAMHRAGGIRVIGKGFAVGELEGTGGKAVHVRNARIGNVAGQTGSTTEEQGHAKVRLAAHCVIGVVPHWSVM